jgi:hypothetical protein
VGVPLARQRGQGAWLGREHSQRPKLRSNKRGANNDQTNSAA